MPTLTSELRRQAHAAERRTEWAYVACALICLACCVALAWLGASVFGHEDMTHPAVIACTIGVALALGACLWFIIVAPKAACDAYLEVLFRR